MTAKDVVRGCSSCGLLKRCTAPVPYSAASAAKILVVIEAPSMEDDRVGKLYMPAFIKSTLKQVGFELNQFALMPTVGCWPSDDDLDWKHVDACAPNRVAQVAEINPTWVLLLGEAALRSFRPDLTVKTARGHRWVSDGMSFFTTYGETVLAKSPLMEQTFVEDLEMFRELVEGRPTDINDRCVMCSEWSIWWTPDELGWCAGHLPEPDLSKFNARLAANGVR